MTNDKLQTGQTWTDGRYFHKMWYAHTSTDTHTHFTLSLCVSASWAYSADTKCCARPSSQPTRQPNIRPSHSSAHTHPAPAHVLSHLSTQHIIHAAYPRSTFYSSVQKKCQRLHRMTSTDKPGAARTRPVRSEHTSLRRTSRS